MRLNQRHRTAIRRTTLSCPLPLALDAGLIDHNIIVLDYGCGRGDDLRGLQAQDIQCYGWDPGYRPGEECRGADVINVEEFLPTDYPLRAKFIHLTQQEERWGLYADPVSIGTKQTWGQLLAAKGVHLSGHRLIRVRK